FSSAAVMCSPSLVRVTSDVATVPPVSVAIVAGGSTTTPIAEVIGIAWIGRQYNVIIINSPKKPPPGIPLMTIPDNKQIPIAIKNVLIPEKSILKTLKTNAIFNIADKQEPSI